MHTSILGDETWTEIPDKICGSWTVGHCTGEKIRTFIATFLSISFCRIQTCAALATLGTKEPSDDAVADRVPSYLKRTVF